jgi:hypothetical protein
MGYTSSQHFALFVVAPGMGLNLNIRRVIFTSMTKWDSTGRWGTPQPLTVLQGISVCWAEQSELHQS